MKFCSYNSSGKPFLSSFVLAGVVLRFCAIAFGLTSILNLTANAGDDAKTMAIEQEVVVTATRSPYSLDRVATTVQVIDQQNIQRSGVRTVVDLLRNHGSVQVRDSSGIDRASNLSLRGFSSSQNVLTLVDGRKLNNTDLAGPSLTTIHLDDVERIEILEGGAGALYGDQAVGGVINIITKREESVGGSVHIGRGSYDNEVYRASYHNTLASGFYYRLNTDVERGDAYRDDTSLNYENYSVVSGYRHHTGEVYVEARQTDNEYLLSGALSVNEEDADRRQAGGSFNDYAEDSRVTQIGLNQHFGEHLELRTSYSDRNEEALIRSESGFGSAVSQQDRRIKLFDPRLIINVDRLRVTLGLDKEDVDYNFLVDFGFGPTGTNQSHNKESEYLHLLFSPHENLDIQGGIRHAKLKVGVQPFNLDYQQGVTVHNVGISWRPSTQGNGNWQIYVNRDETFRFALADENVDFFGNFSLLDVQRGVAWELGNRWEWAELKANLAVFQHDNENEIAYDPMIGVFGANTNLDNTRRRGTTGELSWQASDKLALGTVYSYTDATFVEGVYEGNRIPDVARHLFKLNGSYQPHQHLNLFAEMLYVGSRQLDFTSSTDSLGAYTVFNLTATWHQNNWTLQARLNNIGDKEYSELVSFFGSRGLFPSAERNLMVTLGYDF